MMTGLAMVIFGASAAASGYAIAMTVTPNVARIMSALRGGEPPRFAPLASLVQAERRIAVRRWSSAPAPRPLVRQCEAA